MEFWDAFIDFTKELIGAIIKDQSRAYKFRLACEELVSNIVKASDSNQSSRGAHAQLEVSMIYRRLDEQVWLVLRTQDTGIQFNPHFNQRDPIDTNQPVHERRVGGLGIFLIEQYVDQTKYEWIDGKNCYELSMILWPNDNFTLGYDN
ncbi:ATP-binding protein [Synechococcus sp. EJ6-Ellesmere]|nr:ATP-binding protein [Synechococcus sp. EJ6-Ellesmere]